MNDSFLGKISTLGNLLAKAGSARPPSAALSQSCPRLDVRVELQSHRGFDPPLAAITCEVVPAAWQGKV